MVIRPSLHPYPDGRTPAEYLTQCLVSTRRPHMEVKNFGIYPFKLTGCGKRFASSL